MVESCPAFTTNAAAVKPLCFVQKDHMHYPLFVVAFTFFAFLAPLKVTLITCATLLMITTVVKISAQSVVGLSFSFGEAFKAVALSFFFLVVALFTLFSFSIGTQAQISGLPVLGVLAGFFSAYILGFKWGLGTTFGASAVIALISTLISTLFLWIGKSLLL